MDSQPIGRLEAMVIDVSDLDEASAFWSAVVGQEFGASFETNFRRAKLPMGVDLVLQEVHEAKSGKNRAHLDVEVIDLELGLQRVLAIGGTLVQRVDNPNGDSLLVCADPDGNEFCLTIA
jgi:predicted enzyme related to lactoylglutathione lyase